MKKQVRDCVRSPWSTIAHLLMRYVFAYSVSEEWSAARLERAQRIISERGLHPLTVVQPEYNMMNRHIG